MLQKINWPPDYYTEHRARYYRLSKLLEAKDPRVVAGAINYYRTRPVEFIEHWCVTFDPRNAGSKKRTTMPFILFPRQRDFIEFLQQCVNNEAHGLVEKSRDMGATWLAVAFSVWLFLFVPGATVGWGSRKAHSVDRIGDMGSIFEKIRFTIRALPRVFWPDAFSEDMMSLMKIYSPTGSSITGEAGDDIGRGGRTLIYFKDESAHYEHPEAIEAALSDTTRVQIDISSVNGLGNVFHRKRESGEEYVAGRGVRKDKTNVFVMDWSEHPDKTLSWYKAREAKAIGDGLEHVFRQEVDRNYAASVQGVVIPAEWVRSAIDAHIKLKWPEEERDPCYAGLDVADGGGDRNALAVRVASLLNSVDQWGERDTGVTTRKALDGVSDYASKKRSVHLQYDSVGVGAGVKAESNRLKDDDVMPKHVSIVSWNAGAVVLNPDERVIPDDDDSPLNKEFYRNLKAQAWWQLRLRFERTHRAVTDGVKYDRMELISLPSDLPLLRTLEKELSQPTMSKDSRMKLIIDKQPEGTNSPNLADAVVMAYWPVDEMSYDLDWIR